MSIPDQKFTSAEIEKYLSLFSNSNFQTIDEYYDTEKKLISERKMIISDTYHIKIYYSIENFGFDKKN